MHSDTKKKNWTGSAIAAGLTVLIGLVLWKAVLGEDWVNASYDYLFRFSSRPVTNDVVVILMDNDAHAHFGQLQNDRWDRGLHAQLLEKLADDGCAMVVFDAFFEVLLDPVKDAAIAKGIQRQKNVVLMAFQAASTDREVASARPILPHGLFLEAARNNWGVPWFDPDVDLIVRKHWPFPSSGEPYPSLAWKAAQIFGAPLSQTPQERWLRYYGPNGGWPSLGYRTAMEQPANFFRDKVVFIGKAPSTTMPGDEKDEFRTPYTRWIGNSMAGVHINVAAFLNLVNHEWLRRPAGWCELLSLLASGALLGGLLCRLRLLTAGIVGGFIALALMLGAAIGSHVSNYWFPWVVIAGGQLPVALACAAVVRLRRARKPVADEDLPDIPGYTLVKPSIGEGAYGKVWLGRNTQGYWRAIKVVYLKNFKGDAVPYERELKGIKRYLPVSDKHPGLLQVDSVSEPHPEGYFHYVMELGDSLQAGWEQDTTLFKTRDLVSERKLSPNGKLSPRECVHIGIALADALVFLHRQGLTHRDIKPQNVIFVNGWPKLADLGLVAEIRPADQPLTYVGTMGYMPPPPESPGTVQADVYALGMLLYVLSTGQNPSTFPEISNTLAGSTGAKEFFELNKVITKACQPERNLRFASAEEMHAALLKIHKSL